MADYSDAYGPFPTKSDREVLLEQQVKSLKKEIDELVEEHKDNPTEATISEHQQGFNEGYDLGWTEGRSELLLKILQAALNG